MVEAADLRDRDDATPRWGGHRSGSWRVLVQGEMRSGAVLVGEIAGEEAAQVLLAEHEDMVQTFAPDRTDESLREGILPGSVAP
jgi:hypothetical protein